MLTKRPSRLTFKHFGKLYDFSVSKASYPEDHVVYKLIFNAAKYWFIKNGEQWKVISDLQLSPPLKRHIIHYLQLLDSSPI